jgi:uncharacterized BrkB/YihY/UPF0761 family membrane protein
MSPVARFGALAVGILLVFLITVAVLIRIIPAPRSETDYLVIGGVATLVSMAALFVVLITTVFRSPDTFSRKRKRP